MNCLTNIAVKNKTLGLTQHVPCGQCSICRTNRRIDWAFRIAEELNAARTAHFLTLTYDNDSLPFNFSEEHGTLTQSLSKKHIQDFNKRLRKHKTLLPPNKTFILPYRYFIAGEYGDKTERPHYHLIAFNLEPEILDKFNTIWPHGTTHIGDVTPASIHYSTKYIMKPEKFSPHSELRQKPFQLMSKNPPIGINYIQRTGNKVKYYSELITYTRNGKLFTRLIKKYKIEEIHEYFKSERHHTYLNGKAIRIPRFFKDKLQAKPSIPTQLKNLQEQEEQTIKKWQIQVQSKIRKGYKEPEKLLEEYAYATIQHIFKTTGKSNIL